MFKKLLVTDTHLGMYSDSDAWLDIVLNFYKYITKYCIKHDIREIYHLGDFFDNRKSLNTKTQHVAHRIAKVLGLKENLHTYIIVGNHDCYYKNKIHPNTLELFKEYDNISIIDSIEKIDNILLVPWGEVPEDTQGARFCFGHFAIKGFHMNDSYKCKDGLDKVKFKDFEKVLSGHFHTPSSKGNITYLGSPYGQTFHDAGGVRGFHLFSDGHLEFIEYEDAPKFVKIYTKEEPLNPDEITGNVVKVVFTKDFGTTRNQEIIDNILSHNPFLYSVSFANMDDGEEVDEGEVAYLDSKEKIVDQYIDEQTYPTNIKIDTLKTMFKKMLKEAGVSKSEIKAADGTKIECNEIGFQNFLSFGSKWQDIPLKKGVNFVTGFDKDRGKSNGAGKSSFLETIPFALFGKTAREIKQSQIINWKNKKNCRVVFRFKINEDLYEIERSLKPNKLLIYKNGDIIDQDAHKTDYQSMFENIFGMDVKMFMSLVHSNVNNTASIVSMKKAEKRVFLERMFGLEVYSEMNKIANEKLRSVENKKYKSETDIEHLNSKIESANELIEKFKKEINSKKYIKDELETAKEEFQKISGEYPNIEQDIEDCLVRIKDENDDFSEITISFEKWKANKESALAQIEKQIKNIDDQEDQRKINKEIEDKINAIHEKAGTIEDIQSKIEELEEQYKTESSKFDEYFIKVSDIEKEVIELETNLRNVNKSLKLLSEGKCPTCGQDVADPKGHFEDEKEQIEKDLKNRKDKIKKLAKQRSDWAGKASETKTKIETLHKTKDRLYRLQSNLKDVPDAEEKDELIKEKTEILTAIEKKEKGYKKKEREVNKIIEAIQAKHTDLKLELIHK
jgi:predicted  nucleic acid-binding Zn-ribbon protein